MDVDVGTLTTTFKSSSVELPQGPAACTGA